MNNYSGSSLIDKHSSHHTELMTLFLIFITFQLATNNKLPSKWKGEAAGQSSIAALDALCGGQTTVVSR